MSWIQGIFVSVIAGITAAMPSLKSRLSQLISRYLGAALMALAAKMSVTLDPTNTEGFIATVVAFVMGGLAFLFDLAVHKINAAEKKEDKPKAEEPKSE